MDHREEIMPTFLCFLNWTDQGAKNAKDAVKRYQASKAMAEKLGGRLLSAYSPEEFSKLSAEAPSM